MNELLKKLLEAEILTEDTKQELEAALQTQLDEAVAAAKKEATEVVTADLHESWMKERDTLIEALDSKVTEMVAEEVEELREDIERFRDLEAESAEQLVEAKASMAVTVKGDIKQLIEKLDAFLEVRLTEELEELREDVSVIKKNEFGKNVFEAFVTEFKKHYAGDDSVEAKLSETEQRLEDTLLALEEQEKKAAGLERSIKMEKVLAPLSGRTKEVMEAILARIETPMLEDAYKTYVGRVLKETSSKEVTSEMETKVLAEGKKEAARGVVKTGDNKEAIAEEKVITESETVVVSRLSTDEIARIRALSGLNY